MNPPPIIFQLIERFQRNLDAYRSGRYNETQVRREFIDPFFKALGWDVHNEQGYAEAYKDVIHEDAIKVGGATKAPDYCFRIGGARKFFVEVKKPSINLKDDISPAFQLRRYAWSAKLPLSILTDFEEFAVYDCRIKPDKKDKAATARVLYLTFTEYTERWAEIAGIFHREEVLKGSFDRFAESTRAKRGTAEVDAMFLKEIETWRELLARNFALRNPQLRQRELNFAVQRTIDRIIFLRICEDRSIEDYGRLMALQNGGDVYARLGNLFRLADDRYNAGLFHFHEEKGRSDPPDELTLNLQLDDKPLKNIIRSLYYPDSPYEFSVLPADILGQVYEQFLGKLIRLTPAHRAVVEDKPEVKKAGGVFYTPTYIVEYIVAQTVGKLVEGKTPRQVAGEHRGAPLRVLDPACGSGSFLIGAYQYLLDWYRDRYVEQLGASTNGRGRASNAGTRIYQGPGGEWRLTTAERKRILLTHIYGVDIDPQAVEVTKLSLLLKVLEGESEETLQQQLRLFHQRALPDLGDNIKCGNSLIGPGFYDNQQLSLLDEETHYRVNPFDWQAEYPEIMNAGGFDVVLGNPPYIRIQALKEWTPLEVEYYKQTYASASKGNYDIYVVLVEKGLQLLNQRGRLGYILPHKFFNAQYGQPLRELVARGRHLSHVVHFGDQQVFPGATTYTCLMFLDAAGADECRFVKVDDLTAWRSTGEATEGTLAPEHITSGEWNFVVGKGADLFEKLRSMPIKLGDVADRIAQGIRTSANEVYVLDLVSNQDSVIEAHSRQLDRRVKLESTAVSLFLQGREIKPYRILPSGKVVIIPYSIQNGRTVLIPQSQMRKDRPYTFEYLSANKAYLESRERGRMKGDGWYGYVYPKNIEIMVCPKILVPDIADRASFALDAEGRYAFTSGYGITLNSEFPASPKYVLGLLNSNALDFFLKRVSTTIRGGFFRYFTQYIKQLPIRTINFEDPADKVRHDQMVGLVERMLALHRQMAEAQTAHDQTLLKRQIAATDRQINRLVYELYDLTDDEIRIVKE